MDPSKVFCHNPDCSARGRLGGGNIGIHSREQRRYICHVCGKTFTQSMDTRKIFLANLSRGKLGEHISGLFGGLLVSKIQLTAMGRASQPEEQRVPFYFYVDEFQNFVNESFEVILSEARKYKLCLMIAHQFTGQLPSRLYDAVFGNVGTLLVFEVGVDDATALEKQLGVFTREDRHKNQEASSSIWAACGGTGCSTS